MCARCIINVISFPELGMLQRQIKDDDKVELEFAAGISPTSCMVKNFHDRVMILFFFFSRGPHTKAK